jgi:PAS domain S-box-containing protein
MSAGQTDHNQLNRNQLDLAQIVDSSDDAIIGKTLDGIILSWNRGAERLFGYTAEEVLNQPNSIIVPPDRIGEIPGIMERVLRGDRVDHFETVRLRKDGKRVDVSLTFSSIKDKAGAIIGFSTIARDITERRKMETALVERNRELLTFYKLSEIIHSHRSLNDSYHDIVEEICSATGFPVATIAIYDEERQKIVFQGTRGVALSPDQSAPEAPIDETFSGVVVRTGKPLIEMHSLDHPKYRSEILRRAHAQTFIGYPMQVGQKTIGCLNLAHPDSIEVSKETALWIESLANYVAELTERKHGEEELRTSREQLRELSNHLQFAIEEERKRIAREIHDELGQQLSLLRLELGLMEDQIPAAQKDLRKESHSLAKLIDASIRSVQKISSDLRPTLLDNLGIGAAVEWQTKEFQKRTKIACEVTIDPPEIKLDQERTTALFRILQEALTNIVRHARATKVAVSLILGDHAITLRVHDNGIGITPQHLTDARSFGLMGMRERVHPWGGNVEIHGETGKGTEVMINIPIAL